MVEYRSPKPLMWVRLLLPLPGYLIHILDVFFICTKVNKYVNKVNNSSYSLFYAQFMKKCA